MFSYHRVLRLSVSILILCIFISSYDCLRLKHAKSALATIFTSISLLDGCNIQPAIADTVTVFGGTGFVGSRVVSELVKHGDKVTSISRTGLPPSNVPIDISNKVTWLKGDPTKDNYVSTIKGSDAVVSCIGTIGFDEDVLREGNGIANVAVSKQAKDAGAKRMVYISVSDIVPQALGNVGPFPTYFQGKKDATNAVLNDFGKDSSYFIKPSFIYGGDVFTLNPPRVADFYGKFIDSLLSTSPVRAIAGVSPPLLKVALVPPVSVDHIAQATAASALGLVEAGSYDGSDQINEAAKKMGHF